MRFRGLTNRSVGVVAVCLLLDSSSLAEEKSKGHSVSVRVGMTQSQIQSRIDDAPEHSRVMFQTGTYRIHSLQIRHKRNLKILADGAVSLVCDSSTANVIEVIDSEDIRIEGFRLTHREPSDLEVCVGNVIFVSGGDQTTIRNCDINGCGAIGIYAFTGRLTAVGNHIHENSIRPIVFTGKRLKLIGNRIDNNGDANHIHFRQTDDPQTVKVKERIRLAARPDVRIQGLIMRDNVFGRNSR